MSLVAWAFVTAAAAAEAAANAPLAPVRPPTTIRAPANSPPSDATNLSALDAWQPPAHEDDLRWKTTGEGALVATPGAGNLKSKESFGNVQLHLEFRIPKELTGKGLARGRRPPVFSSGQV